MLPKWYCAAIIFLQCIRITSSITSSEQCNVNCSKTVTVENSNASVWWNETYCIKLMEQYQNKFLHNNSETTQTSFSNSATCSSNISIFFSYWRILFCMRSSSSLSAASQHCLTSVCWPLHFADDYAHTYIHNIWLSLQKPPLSVTY